MAQTKRRRQTKHRGNAAGVVESRGRTGRAPTAAERSPKARAAQSSREKREARLNRPPSWRSAFNRALLAAVIMLAVSLVLLKNKADAVILFPLVLLFYVPLSYYTDSFMYRRRMRLKASGKIR